MFEIPSLSLVQLQRFLAVAEELHFTRAAERLNVSQPLLSAQIRELEESLGAQLLKRTSRKVELSEAGALLRERAEVLLNTVRDTVSATQEVASGRTAPIRIGYTDEFSRHIVPHLVSCLKAEHVSAEIDLILGAVPHLTRGISGGSLDLALLCPLPAKIDSSWQLQTLKDAELVVGLRKDHPLAKEARLSIEQIADQPFVASTVKNAGSEMLVDRLFAEKSLTRQIAQRTSDPHMTSSLVAAGVGILLGTEADFAFYPAVTAIPLQPPVRLRCGAISRASNQGALLNSVRDLLREASGPPTAS